MDHDLHPEPQTASRLQWAGGITLFLLASGFLVYLGLTHTEVGRDYLRQELEAWFAETFTGRVSIGVVSGNLQRRIHLQDVTFYDEQEQVWLHIDEVAAQPNWKAIVGWRFELSTLTITRPSLSMEYHADSTWNLSSVLVRRQDSGLTTWEFESAHISVSDGSVAVSYGGHAPAAIQSGWLFDLSRADLSGISLEGKLNLQPNRKLLEIESLTGAVDTLKFTADGELLLEGNSLHVNALNVSSSVNQATLVGIISHNANFADLSLENSYFRPDFIQSIFPGVLLPGSLSLSGQVHREGAQWSLRDYVIFSDHSRIEIPSAELDTGGDQFSFEASIAPSILGPADFHEVIDLSTWKGGDLQIEGLIAGKGTLSDLVLEGSLNLVTEMGSLAQLKGSARRNRQWNYNAELTTTGMNLYELTGERVLDGMIRGDLSVSGEGIRLPSLSATLALSSSVIGERSLDSLWMEGTLRDKQLILSGLAVEQESRVAAELSADWTGSLLSYESRGTLIQFDLGTSLLIPELETSLNATWELRGTGTDMDDLSASLNIETDSSRVTWEDHARTAPPTRWSIAFQAAAVSAPRIRVQGDVVDLEVSGGFDQSSLRQAGTVWSGAFSEMFSRFAGHRRPDSLLATDDGGPDPQDEARKEGQNQVPAQLTPVELNLDWKFHAHPAMDALLPMLPVFSSSSQGNTVIVADEDSLRLQFQLQDESFVIGDISVHQMALNLDARLNEDMESGWNMDMELTADSLTDNSILIRTPRILVNQNEKTGTLEIHTNRDEPSLQNHLSSDVQLLSDRVRLRIREMRVPIGEDAWSILKPGHIDLFADRAVISPLRLETVNPFLEEAQAMTVQGSLSSLPTDTLKLNLDGVDLTHLSGIMELRRPWGGQVDADLLWTGLWQPEITGTLEVDTLTFGKNLIGHLQASSVLLPGSSDLRLAVTIDSIRTAPAGYLYANNRMTVTGNITVPGPGSPGYFDLSMDAKHLDATFLQLILRDFSDFEGGFTGEVDLRGPLDNPALGGSLTWENGGFQIPKFNSSYETAASVRLRGDRILVDQLTIQDADGGMARIEGALNLNEFQFLSFDASGNFEALQIMNVRSHTRDLAFYGDIRVSGDATLTGPVHTSFLRSDNLTITPRSEIYIPVRESDAPYDPGFIVYVDTTQSVERQLTSFRQRENILGERPEGERLFRDGLDMDLNLVGPPGSSIHLVIDPLLGDIINGIGTGRVQIQRTGGDMATYGFFELSSGDYLFTAGEVFVRRFLIDSGTITWNGEPLNPTLDIQGAYRTRASRNGLPEDVGGAIQTNLPLIVNLNVSGSLNAVLIDLALEIDQRQEAISDSPLLDSYLNRPDLATEHATSVLLTNSFLLSADGARSGILASSAVNSVSSLVASQLNRYLSQIIPQADFRLGVQSDETVQDMDVSAGIALRLLNERLVIRGQGVYRGWNTERVASQGLEGEFIVEIRLSPSVAVEFFYRREGDVLSESLITRETGIGLNYRTEFSSWRQLLGGKSSVESEENSE